MAVVSMPIEDKTHRQLAITHMRRVPKAPGICDGTNTITRASHNGHSLIFWVNRCRKTCHNTHLSRIIYSCATTGNSNTTSFPVRRRYTDENESSLYSNDVASFESRKLYAYEWIVSIVNQSDERTLSTVLIRQRQPVFSCQ